MPSSNHRSSSTHHVSRRTQTHRQVPTPRSSSGPHRQFIIILTNNPNVLRQTVAFQPPQTGQQMQISVPNQNGSIRHETANNNSNREQILNNLLQMELREAARDYLSRTRRAYPIHFVFNMSDIDSEQQSH